MKVFELIEMSSEIRFIVHCFDLIWGIYMPIDIASHTPSIWVCGETLSPHLDILVERRRRRRFFDKSNEDLPAGDAAECEMRERQRRREKPFRVLFRRRSVCVCYTHGRFFCPLYFSSVRRPSRVYITCERAGTEEEKHTHTLAHTTRIYFRWSKHSPESTPHHS